MYILFKGFFFFGMVIYFPLSPRWYIAYFHLLFSHVSSSCCLNYPVLILMCFLESTQAVRKASRVLVVSCHQHVIFPTPVDRYVLSLCFLPMGGCHFQIYIGVWLLIDVTLVVDPTVTFFSHLGSKLGIITWMTVFMQCDYIYVLLTDIGHLSLYTSIF